ncbi:unnamed protein product [Gordionus sp. m RMFG-2023]
MVIKTTKISTTTSQVEELLITTNALTPDSSVIRDPLLLGPITAPGVLSTPQTMITTYCKRLRPSQSGWKS